MNLYKHVSNAINEKLGTTVNLEVPRNRDFGDFSTNCAMVMAKSAGKNPRELATEISAQIAELPFVKKAGRPMFWVKDAPLQAQRKQL